MSDDLRAAIRESMGELNGAAADVGGGVDAGRGGGVEDVAGDGGGGGGQGRAAAHGGATPGDSERDDSHPAGEAAGDVGGETARARDASGKFTKAEAKTETPKPGPAAKAVAPTKAAKTTTPAPVQGQPTQTPAPVAPTPTQTPPPVESKAPQSWKPTAREHFAKLPQEVQAEVTRREKEIAVAMQEGAEARKFHETFQRAVAPFEGMIRQEGREPLQAVNSLLQTAAALRAPSPARVAEVLGSVIKEFGIGRFGPQFIDTLAAAIDGSGQPAQQGQPAHVDPRQIAQQVRADLMQELSQQRQQSLAKKAAEETAQLAGELEFFEDVRQDMADLVEVAARRGVVLSPKDAYARAVGMHPELSQVLRQREAAEQAKAAQASTQRARAASSSVKSEPSGVVAPASADTIRGALREAIAETRRK